jgi:predicted negative regulator of RcsB-dependent stress response
MTTPEQWHRLGELAMAARDSALARKAFEEALDYGREYPGRDRAVARLDSLSSSPAPE